MSDLPDPNPFAGRYPPPLSRRELRAAWERNPSPEVRALLWEVARLHSIARRANQLAACFPLYAGLATSSSFDIILSALRRELAPEPCLDPAFSQAAAPTLPPLPDLPADPWAAKREARRRRNA